MAGRYMDAATGEHEDQRPAGLRLTGSYEPLKSDSSHCRSLDMALDDIRLLLKFRDAPDQKCGDIDALLDERIEHVTTRHTEFLTLPRASEPSRSE